MAALSCLSEEPNGTKDDSGPCIQNTVNSAVPSALWLSDSKSLCPLRSLCQEPSALTPPSHRASFSAEDAPQRAPFFFPCTPPTPGTHSALFTEEHRSTSSVTIPGVGAGNPVTSKLRTVSAPTLSGLPFPSLFPRLLPNPRERF